MTPDPLDDLVRRTVDAVPVPAGLDVRIRRTVARRRLALGAAAAILIAGGLAFYRLRPVEPAISGPVFSLREPAPASLELKDVAFTVEVRPGEPGLAFRFVKGGPSHE